ncbi:MAG: ABC transporter, ATP-binding protein [Eubacteriales bacterium SKADARSKE-1]|nr:ABC transporter, ATP-binding protein [Eubacteriales bacterium SKADARSKE-1]
MEILKTNGLTKIYGKKAAVSNLNMNINKGDIYGFIGKNGAGKTTLIKMVVGLAAPTSGEITLFGSRNLGKGRRNIGTVIEAPAFAPNLSARKNMYIQWQLLDSKNESIIDETLKLVGLDNVGKKKVKNFSLGMKQRLGIAMTLMGEPEFLILDEPVNGLDPEGIIEVRELLLKLNHEKGLTILISSHLLSELSRLATRYGIINDGVLIDELSVEELEKRCKSSLKIKVNDVEKACEVIKTQLNTENYKILDDNTIELFDHLDESGIVNSILAKNDIIINSISTTKSDLESYFMKVIGGNKDE